MVNTKNSEKELVWLLEHESIYTAGTSAKDSDLINNKVEIRRTGRGGQWTWHGPGQRVVYLMLNLKNRLPDVKAYVHALEELVILSLSDFNIYGVRIKNQPGVWVNTNNRLDKIAALGIRISSWITYHGISINLNPNFMEIVGWRKYFHWLCVPYVFIFRGIDGIPRCGVRRGAGGIPITLR